MKKKKKRSPFSQVSKKDFDHLLKCAKINCSEGSRLQKKLIIFAELVAEVENEMCAAVADRVEQTMRRNIDEQDNRDAVIACAYISARIRLRYQEN